MTSSLACLNRTCFFNANHKKLIMLHVPMTKKKRVNKWPEEGMKTQVDAAVKRLALSAHVWPRTQQRVKTVPVKTPGEEFRVAGRDADFNR